MKEIYKTQKCSVSDLKELLDQHGIDYNKWSEIQEAKTIEDLQTERDKQECILTVDESGLIRKTEAIKIKIEYSDESGQLLRLVEDRQEFNNGKFRRRPTSSAVWEKIKPGEDPREEALRGLREELNIDAINIEHIGESANAEPPQDYPGIPTLIEATEFKLQMNNELFLPNGYVENQETKKTFFAWRKYSNNFQQQSEKLIKHSLSELRDERLRLAGICHLALRKLDFSPQAGIIITESFSQGKLSEALSSYDGSSKHLRGALYPCSTAQLLQLVDRRCTFLDEAQALCNRSLIYAADHQLPGDLILGNHAQINLPYGIEIVLSCGKDSEVMFLDCLLAPELSNFDFIEKAKEISAIFNLQMLAEKFGATETLDGLMQGNPEHLAQAKELRNYNFKTWRDIESILIDHDQQIIVGESFTFGKLANLFSGNTAQKSCLTAAYGWYDPNYKIAVGVPNELVTNEKIAEPATVIAGARGLLSRLAPNATIAIGTSGWANNNWLADKADFFSVACIAGQTNGASEKALKFKVLSSQNSPIDYARRDLTRELGVTAALYLLADYLGAYLNPESKANILSKLKEYGEISF